MKRSAAVAVTLAGVAVVAGAVALHLRQRPCGPLAHARTAFSFELDASKHDAFPLFGASGERLWGTNSSGHAWDPQFLWPVPEQDTEGEVFLITHGHHGHTATWINTAFDEATGHVQYVYFLPSVMVTRIDIHLAEAAPGTTQVDVVYEQTALDTSANERIMETPRSRAKMAKEWKEQISTALR
jgi:hypothetical protein